MTSEQPSAMKRTVGAAFFALAAAGCGGGSEGNATGPGDSLNATYTITASTIVSNKASTKVANIFEKVGYNVKSASVSDPKPGDNIACAYDPNQVKSNVYTLIVTPTPNAAPMEGKGTCELTAKTTDGKNLTVVVNAENVDTKGPQTSENWSSIAGTQGTYNWWTIAQPSATDKNPPITDSFATLPSGYSYDPATKVLAADQTAQSADLVYQLVDAAGNATPIPLHVVLSAAPPPPAVEISYAPLTNVSVTVDRENGNDFRATVASGMTCSAKAAGKDLPCAVTITNNPNGMFEIYDASHKLIFSRYAPADGTYTVTTTATASDGTRKDVDIKVTVSTLQQVKPPDNNGCTGVIDQDGYCV